MWLRVENQLRGSSSYPEARKVKKKFVTMLSTKAADPQTELLFFLPEPLSHFF
jgi:hypothetical protein